MNGWLCDVLSIFGANSPYKRGTNSMHIFCGHRSHLRACEWKWWIKIILRFPQSINLKWCSLWIFSSLAWFYLESLFKFGDANLCRPVFNFSHGKLNLVRITYCILLIISLKALHTSLYMDFGRPERNLQRISLIKEQHRCINSCQSESMKRTANAMLCRKLWFQATQGIQSMK